MAPGPEGGLRCDSRFESWYQNLDNVRYYLSLHNVRLYPNKGLIWAIEHHSNILTDYFLYLGANNYETAMITAAKQGNLEVVKIMLNYRDSRSQYHQVDYKNVMYFAAGAGNIEIVKLMLSYGANSYGANNYDITMGNAAMGGYLDIVEQPSGFNDLSSRRGEKINH